MGTETTYLTLDVAGPDGPEGFCIASPLDALEQRLLSGGTLVRLYAVTPVLAKGTGRDGEPPRYTESDGRLVVVAPKHVVSLAPGPPLDAPDPGETT